MSTGRFTVKIISHEEIRGSPEYRLKVDHERGCCAYDIRESEDGPILQLSAYQAEHLRDWLSECLNDQFVLSDAEAEELGQIAKDIQKRLKRLSTKKVKA